MSFPSEYPFGNGRSPFSGYRDRAFEEGCQPLREGEEYEAVLNGWGCMQNKFPYCWVNPAGGGRGVRVFLNDYLAGSAAGGKKVWKAQPGDRVRLRISRPEPRCAHAYLVENLGCVFEPVSGREYRVVTHAPGLFDARDAVSLPERGGGVSGILTTVKRSEVFHDEQGVRIAEWRKGGSDGSRHHIVAELANRGSERPVEREVYVGCWEAAYGTPTLRSIPEKLRGVPRALDAALVINSIGEGGIVTDGVLLTARYVSDVADYTVPGCVSMLYEGVADPRRFRVAVGTTWDARETIREAVPQAPDHPDLIAVDLPMSRGW